MYKYTAVLSVYRVYAAHLSVVCTECIGCISVFFYSMQGSFECIKKQKSGVHRVYWMYITLFYSM